MKRIVTFIFLLAMLPLSASGYWELVDSRIVPTTDYTKDKSLTVHASLTNASIVHQFKSGDETITHSSSAAWRMPPSIIKPEDKFEMFGSFTVNEAANNFAVTVYTLSVSAVENDGGIHGSVVTVSEGTWVNKKWEIRSPVSFGEGYLGELKRIHVDAYKNIILFTYEWKEGRPPGSFLGIKKKVRSAPDEGSSGKPATQGETSQSSSSKKKEKLPWFPAVAAAAGLALFNALPEFVKLLIKKKGPNGDSRKKESKRPGKDGFALDARTSVGLGLLKDSYSKTGFFPSFVDLANTYSDYNARRSEGYSRIASMGIAVTQNIAASFGLDKLGGSVSPLENIAKVLLPKRFHEILPTEIIKTFVKLGSDLYSGATGNAWEKLKNTGSIVEAGKEFVDTVIKDSDKFSQAALNGSKGVFAKGYAEASKAAGEIYHDIETKGFWKSVCGFSEESKSLYDNGRIQDVYYRQIDDIAAAAIKGSGPVRVLAEMSQASGDFIAQVQQKGIGTASVDAVSGVVKDLMDKNNYGNKVEIMDSISKAMDKNMSTLGKPFGVLNEYYAKGGGVIGGAKAFTKDCTSIIINLWQNGFGS